MSNPLVSVIVPIYNVEPYLRQCIDSVLNQTYTNLEIILVDDGSPDNSPAICDDYATMDERVSVIHKMNGGLSDARNTGIDKSNGQYIFFLDADDYLAPECIASLIVASDNGAFAISGYKLDFTNKRLVVDARQPYGQYATLTDYLKDFHNLFATKFNFAWGKLYETAILKRYSLRFKKGISLVEDVLFNLDYYRHCDKGIVAIPYDGYYYRQHSSATLSKKFDARMFDWNERGFAAVKQFLEGYGCLTDVNRIHLYRNIVGNYNYSFCLIANNQSMNMTDKVMLIRKYLHTPIYQEAIKVGQNLRPDYKLLQFFLKHSMVKSYIRLQNIKKWLNNARNK